MKESGDEKEDWFRILPELPDGVPSRDNFYRMFCLLNPDKFQECFTCWVKLAFPQAPDISDDDTHIVPMDGKAIKGSRGQGKGKRAVHIVSAWRSKLSLVPGQKKVDHYDWCISPAVIPEYATTTIVITMTIFLQSFLPFILR